MAPSTSNARSIEEDTTAFFQDANIIATLSTRPSTPGDTLIRIKAGPLNQLSRSDFISVLQSTKVAASIVKKATQVQRVALATTSNDSIKLIPLHGLSANWKPILDSQKEYHTTYPGHVSSRSGPKSPDSTLTTIQAQLTNNNPPALNTTCTSPPGASSNLFARIIRAEIPSQWRIWSSDEHLAFLTPYANSPGKTILVPRKHLDSNILALSDEGDFKALMGAVWDVMLAIRKSQFAAQRVGLIFEGMEIDWAHARLIPIREGEGEGEVLQDDYGGEQGFAERYEGSVSSLPGPEVGLGELVGLLARFRAVAAGDLSGE